MGLAREADLGGNGRGAVLRKESSAPATDSGASRIAVAIEKALMPGSSTPKPSAVHIHSWPGCQRRTSSFQVMTSSASRRPASLRRASSTAALKRECHVAKRLTPLLRSGGADCVEIRH